jgi:hypothetical protein
MSLPRGGLLDAIALSRTCSNCGVDSLEFTALPDGYVLCAACKERQRERYEAATGRCYRECGYDLAWHPQPRSVGDACPTEAEARERSGAQ